jgi:F-type H+-transporting ATPase subunit epsilon
VTGIDYGLLIIGKLLALQSSIINRQSSIEAMATTESKTFTCTLITPAGRLLDCAATSVILPAHDGQVGILYDHMPMLCQLGLGPMNVTVASTEGAPSASATPSTFFIDGGFALVAVNSVTVVAYEAVSLHEDRSEKLQSMMDKATKNVADGALPGKQRAHETERLRVLARLAGTDRPSAE